MGIEFKMPVALRLKHEVRWTNRSEALGGQRNKNLRCAGELAHPAIVSHIRLLNGHGLRQIPRLVDIASVESRNVIGEELERDDREEGA